MVFRYHYWNRKLLELVFRALLTDGAPEVRFELAIMDYTSRDR